MTDNKPQPQYFKSKYSDREFYEVNANIVCSVLSKNRLSSVEIYDSAMMAEAVSSGDFVECPKQEFEKAYSEAMAVLSMRKIV